MKYDFKITIQRIIGKTMHGTSMVFDADADLDEIFQPKVVSMILKDWAKHLEETQAIIPCAFEEARARDKMYE